MAGQGLVNPLAYYTPGIPGRGAGTIFKAPDLSGVVDKFGKMKAVKDAAQAKEDDDAQKNVEKLMELKGTIDEEITKEGNEKVKTFFGEVQKEISKNDGDLSKVDMPRLKRLKWETENFLTQGTLIGKEHDDVSKKWTAMKMTDNFDDDYLDEQFKQIEAESQKPLMERRYTSILNTPKVYDFTKKTGELNKQVPKFETGTLSSPQVDAEGIMRQSGTKVSGVSTSQVLNKYTDALIYDKKWNKAFNGEYVELMKMYPQGLPVNYNSVEIDPNTKKVTVTPVSETITRPEQLLKYKAAQASYLKYEPIEKAQRQSGVSVNVSNEQQAGGRPEYQHYDYTFSLPSGDVAKGEYVAMKSATNPFSKDPQTTTLIQFTKKAFSYGGRAVKFDKNYEIDNASVDLLPVATQSIKLKNGSVIPAGTQLGDVGDFNVDDFVKNDSNKGKWKWVAHYNVRAKTDTGDYTNVYEGIRNNPTLSNYFKGKVNYNSREMNFMDYVYQWENDMNSAYGNITGGATSTSPAKNTPAAKNKPTDVSNIFNN